MITPILAISPSFQPTWDDFASEWKNAPDGLPLYLILGDLARHIATLHRNGQVAELRAIFQVVEEWHLHGDAYVKEVATVGLLEDLQNTNVVGDGVPLRLVAYLGPESARWWRKVEAFWEQAQIIRDD